MDQATKVLEAVLARNDGWWCDDKTTPTTETCADQAGLALTRALDELQPLAPPQPASRPAQHAAAHASRDPHRRQA